jgi:hypothetical protein
VSAEQRASNMLTNDGLDSAPVEPAGHVTLPGLAIAGLGGSSGHATGDIDPIVTTDALGGAEAAAAEASAADRPALPATGPDPVDDVAIRLPDPYETPRRAHHEQRMRAEARLGRRRFYSYCLTLTACVFALMTFMYGVQGQADSDGTFIGLGMLFAATTAFLLWAAVRITRVDSYAHD